MKKNFFKYALMATALFTAGVFTSCDDDDDDDNKGSYDIESKISFENMVSMKEFVQTGTFGSVAAGGSTSITFNAGKNQRLMFATMYGYSNDMFFAPENPGLELFNSNGEAITGDVSSKIYLWDNGTRENEQPSATVEHPGVAEDGTVKKIETQDAQGNLYRPASELVKLTLAYNATSSQFTLTIENTSGGTINETPLSAGVWVVSNYINGSLVKSEPFFKENEKSSPQLTALAESGQNNLLNEMVSEMKGIVTGLSPAVVVVYTGNINPIYQLGQKDGNIGLKELAQKGDPSKLKSSLEGMTNVRNVYVTGSAAPGNKTEITFKAWENDRIAYATMFGSSNDWFFSNGESIPASTKGDVTGKTVLLDNGTGVNQYPGAGNHQNLFGGTPESEDKAIEAVGNAFPVPDVNKIIKITIQ